MKKAIFSLVALGLMISACLPAFPQPQNNPPPLSEEELRGTAAVLSQQTLQALPTQSPIPSATPVIVSPEPVGTQPTATETANPVLLTLTATLLAGTPTGSQTTGTFPAANGTGTNSAPVNQATATQGTPQPLFYGTLPPSLPSGTVEFFNKAQVEVYISLRCVTKDGNVTIIEYPVKKNFKTAAPAGQYTYIAWVGGRQFDGSFKLDTDGFVSITFFKDRINVKNK